MSEWFYLFLFVKYRTPSVHATRNVDGFRWCVQANADEEMDKKGSGANVIVLHYSISFFTHSHLLNAMSRIAKLKSAHRTKGGEKMSTSSSKSAIVCVWGSIVM